MGKPKAHNVHILHLTNYVISFTSKMGAVHKSALVRCIYKQHIQNILAIYRESLPSA